ncbi:hypothetical protein D6D85_01010 [Candidatus Methanodesulfokora washburnensis]|jgi:hypothetical protein|uniref:Uncharacterized protein n=1 Tax=Candidatus Methanodesulfokora washburnensis TaxID=2478471 RepID=A0A3R9Q110_9CREN|nr:hypothetical protein D6D85_01010 [Candidatus Methanodesulfokores washburnensis]
MVSANIRVFPVEKPVGMFRETAGHEENRINNAYLVWNNVKTSIKLIGTHSLLLKRLGELAYGRRGK